MVSGKDTEDHLMLYDELQKQDDFYVLTSERGERNSNRRWIWKIKTFQIT